MLYHLFRQLGVSLMLISLIAAPLVVFAQDTTLTETFVSDDGLLTFQYPGAWVAAEVEPGIFSTTNDVNNVNPVVISIFTTPAVDDIMLQWGFDSTMGANVVGNLVASLLPPGESDNTSEFTTFDDGRDIFLYFHISPNNSQNALWMLAFEDAASHAVLLAFLDAPADEVESYRDTLFAIAASVQYTPPEKESVGTVIWQQEYTMNPDDPEAIGDLSGLGIGSDGTIYLTDRVNGIHVFNPDGEKLDHLAGPPDAKLDDVAVDADGTLWAVDAQNQVVFHLDAGGMILETMDTPPLSPDDTQWSTAQIEINPDKLLCILFAGSVGGNSEYQAQVWDMQGTVLATFPVESPSQFPPPLYMDTGPDGNLYFMGLVGDLWVMDVEGNITQDHGMIMRAANTTGLATAPDGSIFFSADWGGVWYFDPGGKNAGSLAQLPLESVEQENGVYFNPGGLGLLPDGDIVLIDSYKDAAVITRFHFNAFSGMSTVPAEPPALTETFTASDGQFTFNYPADWAVEEIKQGTVVLANNRQAMEAYNYGPGDVMFNFSWFSLNDPNTQLAPTTERTAPGIAVELRATFTASSPDASFSEPESFTLNERPAARFEGTASGKAFVVLVLDLGNDEIGFVAMMANNTVEAGQFEPTLTGIAASITYHVDP